ncbi:poly(A) polymerase [Hydrococcus rivularis NIES-593]|uniref:Poly(A) polymerase n=1 Tax=Hydrococcus rivularis NIES-593 TaxID=1921803 RepID=A0A1U7HMU1_9CYAN|nr:CBS domain-containing protein [Hydrococcus rivularis]OKH24912.1 poly(A) polymerase [Hydrococcus rivularis NIES-593]
MDLILCHQTADFDVLGAAVGLSRLKIGSRIVLTGGAHPAVRDFLALHRDELSLIEMRSVNPKKIRSLAVVDNQQRDRLGKAAEWFDLPQVKAIAIYDHHLDSSSDIPATEKQIEAVGATTTLIVERLQQAKIRLNPVEATVMALGIHVDTGSLTFPQSTARDARALAWLMEMGANVKTIAEYADPGFPPHLQQLLTEAIEKLQTTVVRGYAIASVLLTTETFVPGLSNLAERLIELTESDALLFAHQYSRGRGDNTYKEVRLTIIGRSRIEGTNLHQLFEPLGGGGHAQAASVILRGVDPEATLRELVERLKEQIPHPPTARDLMSSPVRTIRPDTTIEQAQRILFRYGHSGLSVVDESDRLVGVISRRDIDLALHHGFSHAPVKGYMTRNLRTIKPDTPLPDIESIMVTYDVGRLPVVESGQLIGIVTRTDVLRQIHNDRTHKRDEQGRKEPLVSCLLPSLQNRLRPSLWQFLTKAAQEAQQRGWHLYLVGGAVRDLLLAENHESLLLQDIDLVVDGFHRSADVGAGVELAARLREIYPQARLSVHGEFQTAALLWHKDPEFGSLWVDIATARTEFYPYPAANPEVEASSIRQDLYRRDFTINALAVRLTSPKEGELLDFFGGMLDLRSRQIRVLHANSFIEDPTRIYRAVRFAVRLGFEIEPQTEEYIRYAIESGVYDRLKLENHPAPALTTRLKAELHYILEADYWKPALRLLADLGALRCLHPTLVLDKKLWWQIRCVSRWLRWLDPENLLHHWLIRLEVLLSAIESSEGVKIATNLQLPKDSLERLEQLKTIEREVNSALPKCDRPSEVVNLLRQYKLASLILVAIRSSINIRRTIWHYLARWSQVRSPLDGNDLKAMGYKPGPQYREILDELLAATLDGKIGTREEAERFLQDLKARNRLCC